MRVSIVLIRTSEVMFCSGKMKLLGEFEHYKRARKSVKKLLTTNLS